ncbi:hypothetical protein GHT06_022052 [Daphnia sinensis]|uniref:Hexosyltransferase n=1 Tax=Daphnia sinensis TaxID=1820382 RepID=A0AAD5PLA8_9CRUS|nr:hypothetical protein GHT06_022052 [Daphnia sinensis]
MVMQLESCFLFSRFLFARQVRNIVSAHQAWVTNCFGSCSTFPAMFSTEENGLRHKRPRPASAHRLYPSNWTLVNLKRFEFLLNSDPCSGRQRVDLLVIVTSHPGHSSLRNAFRRGLPTEALRAFYIKRVFLLARINPGQSGYRQVDQTAIEEEHLNYNDIVQGDFIESYHNLSYKHVMGLKYSAEFCPQAELVLKMDDDIAVDLFQLLNLVRNQSLSGMQIAGAVMAGDELNPVRNKNSKWYVSRDDYAPSTYPLFVSGWAYVTTVQAAIQLVRHAESSPFFWIDDTYVTGMLAALSGVKHVDIRPRFTVFVDHLRCCLRNHETACDYFIGPSDDDVELIEAFHRQSLHCKINYCPPTNETDKPSLCVITNHPPNTYNKLEGRIIHGQVIPLL